MISLSTRARSDAAAISLETFAEQAGAAMACAYSSSAEYDAALIAERRAAGVYGPKRQRRYMLLTVGGVVAALTVLVLVIELVG